MRKSLALCLTKVVNQGAGRLQARSKVLTTEALEGLRAELAEQSLTGGAGIEVPLGERSQRAMRERILNPRERRKVLGTQSLRKEALDRADA